MDHLIQPILSSKPEIGHDPNKVLTFEQFIRLLKKEEDYFEEDKFNTRVMITRLRKIFYDGRGWNSQLIKKAAFISGRYKVKTTDCPKTAKEEERILRKPDKEEYRTLSKTDKDGYRILSEIRRYQKNEYRPKCRLVTYRNNDRVYGNRRAGQIPLIYICDHQDVSLREGYHCDIGHVFAGLDALNNFQKVSPIPDWLFFLRRFFPCADSNADVTTWLGDIATSAAAFVFHFLRNGEPPDEKDEQKYINTCASASDMLGNIDAFVIHNCYNTNVNQGKPVSKILEDYYGNENNETGFRKKRFSIFCKAVGLKNWNGFQFSNEEEWMGYYGDQLRNTTAFMAFSTSSLKQRLKLPHMIWKKRFEEIIKVRILLEIFLVELKKLL